MTPQQGRGVQAWMRLANEGLNRMPRAEARSLIDALTHEELADMLAVSSAAGVAVDGPTGGNLLFESAAARLRSCTDDSDDEATEGAPQ